MKTIRTAPFSVTVTENTCCIRSYDGNDARVTIPERIQGLPVTSIGEFAFAMNLFLKEVKLPDTVESIAPNAFACCNGMGDKQGLVVVGKFLCETVKKRKMKITLPEGVEEITSMAFADCRSLREVTLSEGVKTLRTDAFFQCKALRTVTIPDSVENLEPYAFRRCLNLQRVNVSKKVLDRIEPDRIRKQFLKAPLITARLMAENFSEEPLDPYIISHLTAKKQREKYLPFLVREGLAKPLAAIFSACKQLELQELEFLTELSPNKGQGEIKTLLMEEFGKRFPAEEMEKIQRRRDEVELGFAERTLKEWREIFGFFPRNGTVTVSSCKRRDPDVIIPEKAAGLPVTCIQRDCFRGCDFLTSVFIPDCVREIRAGAFCDCVLLERVTLPKALEKLSDGLFSGCRSLVSLRIPSSVREIGSEHLTYETDGVFQFCESLTSVNLPEGLEVIGCRAFRDCASLETLTLPRSLKRIGNGAFRRCDRLVLKVYAGSYGEDYAKEHAIPYVVL